MPSLPLQKPSNANYNYAVATIANANDSTHTLSHPGSLDAYTIEEERIIDVLSRKLEQVCCLFFLSSNLYSTSSTYKSYNLSFHEQLRESKLNLENALDAESENNQVSKLTREIGELRRVNGELEMQLKALRTGEEKGKGAGATTSCTNGNGMNGHGTILSHGKVVQSHLSTSTDAELELESEAESYVEMEMLLEAMRRENEELRNRLADTERGYMRISALNEAYREELIEHRRKVS